MSISIGRALATTATLTAALLAFVSCEQKDPRPSYRPQTKTHCDPGGPMPATAAQCAMCANRTACCGKLGNPPGCMTINSEALPAPSTQAVLDMIPSSILEQVDLAGLTTELESFLDSLTLTAYAKVYGVVSSTTGAQWAELSVQLIVGLPFYNEVLNNWAHAWNLDPSQQGDRNAIYRGWFFYTYFPQASSSSNADVNSAEEGLQEGAKPVRPH